MNIIKLASLSILLSCYSCSVQNEEYQDKKVDTILADSLAVSTKDNKFPDTIKVDSMIGDFYGQWINTSLFDSTIEQKKLYPWIDQFYGDLTLTVKESNTVFIGGNMDGGEGKLELIDSLTFTIPGRNDKPTFKYLPGKDLIQQVNQSGEIIAFRRVSSKDSLSIIGNESEFNEYFIDTLFKDYEIDSTIPNVLGLWTGFATHRPFDFDAIAYMDQNDSVIYLGWTFIGDTLNFYHTSFEYEEDSGFRVFNKEALVHIIIKN